jgi:hypothetical protein
MPDPNEIARQIVPFLAPFLPYLLKAGEKAAEEAGRKLGAAAWEQAQALWARLRRKKNVEQVAHTVAALPDNQALREALREEIARALAEDDSRRRNLPACCRNPAPPGRPSLPAATVLWRSVAA